jgi:hypothetical protein
MKMLTGFWRNITINYYVKLSGLALLKFFLRIRQKLNFPVSFWLIYRRDIEMSNYINF